MSPVRLIVADLDGTLLTSDHIVSPFTEAAVRAAQARGVLFTVATGKTFPSTVALIEQFGITIPLICGNGTQVFAPDGTLVYENPIPLDCALEAIGMAEARGFTPVVYTAKGLLSTVHDANVAELLEHHEPLPDLVDDWATALRGHYRPFKMVLMHQDHDRASRFFDDLWRAFDGRAQVVRSGLASVVEVMPAGVTKGTALARLVEHLGLDVRDALCLGDNCNDLDMIRRAGIGVAMRHAPQEVRAAADYVTGSNDEDGVGHAIHRFVLAAPGTETAPDPSERRTAS
ncbi:MAG: Cof-type HAD-IIB family hydrolase [Anaerolineae bacterium]|nr:Cof-type HAD-IIB family hydrolase [Anaerolineae bacterium]